MLLYSLLLPLTLVYGIHDFHKITDDNLSKIKVDSSSAFVDNFGRTRIFHGINMVEKGFPWYPAQLLNNTYVENLAVWGFNVVRLGMMWSGVEIGPYSVNETYLTIMESIIINLAKRDIYVILDMHQDVLSSKFGSYDGSPLWLIESFGQSEHDFPWPFISTPSQWFLGYVTFACSDAFHHLYANRSGALDHFSFFWQTVAKRFGKYPSVLGYELINEPWPGNVYTKPDIFEPGNAGSQVLLPLYDFLFNAITQYDNQTLLFYEPVTWGMIFHGGSFGSGFSRIPGGDNFKSRAVFSFHYYCWFIGVDDLKPFPWWWKAICDHLLFPDVIKTVKLDVADTGGGYFMTEFGQCEASASHSTAEYQECFNVLNISDASFVSWSYWDSAFYFPNGSVNTDNVLLFSRTYAQAIAGKPIHSQFDPDTGDYFLSFMSNPTITTPTVIYASPAHYPSGFTVRTVNATSILLNDFVFILNVNDSSCIVQVYIQKKQF